MNERQLRTTSGLLVLTMHLATSVSVIALFCLNWLRMEEMTTLLAIVVPMLGFYTSMYVATLNKNPSKTAASRRPVTKEFAGLLIGLISMLGGAILLLIWLRAFGAIGISFEELKGTLGICEVIYGSLAAKLYFSQFKISVA